MIGSTTSANPARYSACTNRASMRRRRAVSSISSGRTPVGYRYLLAISKKPLPPVGEEAGQCLRLRSAAPLLNVGRSYSAPLHHVVMMVVRPVSESRVHKNCASLKTTPGVVKFPLFGVRRLGGCLKIHQGRPSPGASRHPLPQAGEGPRDPSPRVRGEGAAERRMR